MSLLQMENLHCLSEKENVKINRIKSFSTSTESSANHHLASFCCTTQVTNRQTKTIMKRGYSRLQSILQISFTILRARESNMFSWLMSCTRAKVYKDDILSSNNPLVLKDRIHILIYGSFYKEVPLERHMKISF